MAVSNIDFSRLNERSVTGADQLPVLHRCLVCGFKAFDSFQFVNIRAEVMRVEIVALEKKPGALPGFFRPCSWLRRSGIRVGPAQNIQLPGTG